MRKAKVNTKSDNRADAFFENENFSEDADLGFVNDASLREPEKEKISGDDALKTFITLLKRVFLFLPGSFLLFFMSFGAAVIFLEIVVFRGEIQTLPDNYPFQFAFIGLIIFLGTLMTWFGLGDIKNKKHLAIPASLFVSGAAPGAIIKAAASFSKFADRILDDIDYLIYLFPAALIIAVLAKGIVDRKTANADE